MNFKKCILIKGVTQYDVLNCFIDCLESSFHKLGYDCIVLTLNNPANIALYKEYCNNKEIDFIFSFNGMGTLDIYNTSGSPWINQSNIPFICFMVDGPFHHYPRLSLHANHAIYTFVDQEHVYHFKKYTNKKAHFVPHGGCMSQSSTPVEWLNKKNEILFLGSIVDMNALYHTTKTDLPPNFLLLFNKVLEIMLSDNQKTYLQVLEEVNSYYQFASTKDEIVLLSAVLSKADLFVRTKRRIDFISSLVKMGIPVSIYGNGWSKTNLNQYKNCYIRNGCNFYFAMKKMKEFKIVLNILPLFANGSHERIFTANLNSTVCATDKTIFLNKLFQHEESILFYEHNQMESFCSSVEKIFSDTMLFDKITSNAKKIAQDYTWDAIAKKVLTLLKETNFDKKTL